MTDKSREYFERSRKVVPGGVHSPVRSFKGLHRGPLFIERAKGPYLYDDQNNSYIDFCMSFGPLILGHAHPEVEQALHGALERGWSFGAAERYSLELAEFILSKISFIDQLRFVNSGTEAVMTAIRLARGVTGKNKILKFNGCYHGHVDSMLIKAGSGLAGTAEASSKGIPQGVANDTIVVELNSKEDVTKAFAKYPNEIAAILVEPLPANNGLLVQDQEFLSFLREISKKNSSLLIFDEVISGFRVAFGGMAEKTGITPDLVTYGKIIGGGLPVGAIGAKKEIMEHLAPLGGVYQAGTLSANPLAMVGGLATLKLLTPDIYKTLKVQTSQICEIFKDYFQKENLEDMHLIQSESLFWIHPDNAHPKSIGEISPKLIERFNQLFEHCFSRGIYLSPNGYEVGFGSLAHDPKCLEELRHRLCN